MLLVILSEILQSSLILSLNLDYLTTIPYKQYVVRTVTQSMSVNSRSRSNVSISSLE